MNAESVRVTGGPKKRTIHYLRLDCKTLRRIDQVLRDIGGSYNYREAIEVLTRAQRKVWKLRSSKTRHFRILDVCQETGWSEYMVIGNQWQAMQGLANSIGARTGVPIVLKRG